MSKVVNNLQLERGMTSNYLTSRTTEMLTQVKFQWKVTDERISAMTFWPDPSYFYNGTMPKGQLIPGKMIAAKSDLILALTWFRSQVDAIADKLTLNDVLTFYSHYVNIFLEWGSISLTFPPGTNLWTNMLAFNSLLRITESIGLQRAMGSVWYYNCNLTEEIFVKFLRHRGMELGEVEVSSEYCKECIENIPIMLNKRYPNLLDQMATMRAGMVNKTYVNWCKSQSQNFRDEMANHWFRNTTAIIGVYSDEVSVLANIITKELQVAVNSSFSNLVSFSTLFVVITLVSLFATLWYSSSIRSMARMISSYALELRKKIKLLQLEKKRTEALLFQMLPRSVADQLTKRQTVEAETYQCVTIYFSDIVGFTTISSSISPMDVIEFLNSLYSTYDDIIQKYDAFKVETIGDAYMVASGVPIRNGDMHSSEIAEIAIDIRDSMKEFNTKVVEKGRTQIRIGIHSGPVVAGIVGTKMPRYCLFGETVLVANTMESSGAAQYVQISYRTYDLLDQVGGFNMTYRHEMMIQGKPIKTYWLDSRLPFRK